MKTIYYRGLLHSCNYNCAYCTFAARRKVHNHTDDIQADQHALLRFCSRTKALGTENIIFVPYGEVMLHSYYWEAIADLCNNPNTKRVECQTNLSFDVDAFADFMATATRNSGKINLWCSFHPSQVGIDEFLEKCDRLYERGINFSAGAVGSSQNFEILRELRERLPESVYFWVNALKKNRTPKQETAQFLQIDPMFALETAQIPANSALCRAGKESFFVEANGSVYACPISKVRLGDFYSDMPLRTNNICRAVSCNCYLAYVNRLHFHR